METHRESAAAALTGLLDSVDLLTARQMAWNYLHSWTENSGDETFLDKTRFSPAYVTHSTEGRDKMQRAIECVQETMPVRHT
jgi:hypothetical protein